MTIELIQAPIDEVLPDLGSQCAQHRPMKNVAVAMQGVRHEDVRRRLARNA